MSHMDICAAHEIWFVIRFSGSHALDLPLALCGQSRKHHGLGGSYCACSDTLLAILQRCMEKASYHVHASILHRAPTSNNVRGRGMPSSFEVLHISHSSRLDSMPSNNSQIIQLIITREISHNESLQLNSQIRPVT